jgi:hypothetical protein
MSIFFRICPFDQHTCSQRACNPTITEHCPILKDMPATTAPIPTPVQEPEGPYYADYC